MSPVKLTDGRQGGGRGWGAEGRCAKLQTNAAKSIGRQPQDDAFVSKGFFKTKFGKFCTYVSNTFQFLTKVS